MNDKIEFTIEFSFAAVDDLRLLWNLIIYFLFSFFSYRIASSLQSLIPIQISSINEAHVK